MKSFLKYWLPVFVWLVVIFAGSTEIFSAEQTSRYLVPFLRWLDPQISPSTIAAVHFGLRKLGHLAEYAVLAALLWRALRSVTILRAKIPIVFVGAWVACTIFAASDEFHQSFVPSRIAATADVLIDIGGAVIGLAICWVFARRKSVGVFARRIDSGEDRHPKI
jgi:VanZ family protein